MNRKSPITVFLDASDLEKLEEISQNTGESLSALIRKSVKKFLEEFS